MRWSHGLRAGPGLSHRAGSTILSMPAAKSNASGPPPATACAHSQPFPGALGLLHENTVRDRCRRRHTCRHRKASMAARYYDELLGHFTRTLRDCDAAADIVQEAYAR